MSKRNFFIIYLLLTGQFVRPNKDHILPKNMNESYNLGYGIMTYIPKNGDNNEIETSTSTYFKSSTQNANNFSMTIYNLSSVNNIPTTKPYSDYNPISNQHKLSDTFLYIKSGIALVLIIVGLVGNCLSFLIIVRQGLIKSGIWVYLATLAITDSLALITGAAYEFSKPPFNIFGNLQNNSDIFCKFLLSFGYIWSLMNNYILSFMSVERCVIIVNPYRVPPGQKRATISVLIIVGVILLVQPTYIFNCFGVVEFDALNLKLCTILPKYENIFTYIFTIDALIFIAIPIILIFSANSCIIFSLMKRYKNGKLNKVHKNSKKDINISIMLIVVSLLFLITVTPTGVYYSTLNYSSTGFEEATAFGNISWTIIGSLYQINYCLNFFVYGLTGENFRKSWCYFFGASHVVRYQQRLRDRLQSLRGNVGENQRGALTCRRNLCSPGGSFIHGPWTLYL